MACISGFLFISHNGQKLQINNEGLIFELDTEIDVCYLPRDGYVKMCVNGQLNNLIRCFCITLSKSKLFVLKDFIEKNNLHNKLNMKLGEKKLCTNCIKIVEETHLKYSPRRYGAKHINRQ